MKFGIFSKVFLEYPFQEALERISASGFDTIQFNFANVGLSSLPKSIDNQVIEDIKKLCKKSGVEIALISGTFNTLELNKIKREENLKGFEQVVKACNKLGVPYVSISTGSFNQADFWSPHPDNHTEKAWQLLHESLTEMLEIAKENQVTIVFEPEQANVVSSTKDSLRLINMFDSEYLKVLYDPANIVTTADADNQLGKIKSSLEQLKDVIAIAHCKDAYVTKKEIKFAPVGKGTIPLNDYLTELTKFYSGPIIMHGLEETDIEYALSYLDMVEGN
ncbi:sugar phosphate isomerase/epimerase family protein [Enterococcus sp. AZ103]|uniref:sugar phosphate isomerase/epimerase family protein n=1 Tax=Enterococcus sp. AZ103 TaxID=2774628 RepID=UPI003F252B18